MPEEVSAADAAWLEAGAPLSAAELHAALAERAHAPGLGLEHARRALVLARASEQPGAVPALLERMRTLFPHDLDLLELQVLLTGS